MPTDPPVSNLAALRLARGWSTRDLAQRSGVQQPLISRYEHRTAPKGLKSALAIAAALHVPVLAIWPDARPQPNPKRARPQAASAGTSGQRTAPKNQAKRNR